MTIILGKVMPVGISMIFACWMMSFAIAIAVVYVLNQYLPFMFDIRNLKKTH